MNLLIPYVHLIPPDPLFDEYTYGDVGQRARQLKKKVKPGDFIFFHASKGGKKYITAYYVVDRVLDTIVAAHDRLINGKYRNPHIIECLQGKRPRPGDDDAIVFGDPIQSRALPKPLPFDRHLSEKLSLDIKFHQDRRDTQIIGSATRAWRELTDKDVSIILEEIDKLKDVQPAIKPLMSTEEVSETLERDIEDYIANNPELIGKNLKLAEPGRQVEIDTGRIDLLLVDDKNNWVVIEVKSNWLGRDALRQVKNYVKELAKKYPKKNITGVLVGADIMPAFEEELRKQTEIRILTYGWNLSVHNWTD